MISVADKIIGAIEKYRETLKSFGVVRIGLFGSCLKGEHRNDSDADLLVTLDEKGVANYFDLWLYLDKILERKVDLVIEKNLFRQIEYVKGEARYARL
jgi:uncharacterized protein